jgi:uncharacterized protein involved in type VI secretion and phage assembly
MGRLSARDLASDSLRGTQWVGVVEDTEDELFEGRVRLRVFGKMDQRVDPEDPESDYVMPTAALPWARPSVASSGGSNSGSGTFSVPKIGTIVRVTFDNGNYYSPVYHESLYPSDELKAEIEASYQNSHVLIYDTAFGLTGGGNEEVTNEREGESIKVFFTEEKGLMMDYTTTEGPTTVNIKPDNSVEIINANGDSILMENNGNINITCTNANINASGETHINSTRIKLVEEAAEAVMKGDTFKAIFDAHIHPTGVGPSGPPTQPSITDSYLSKKNTTD